MKSILFIALSVCMTKWCGGRLHEEHEYTFEDYITVKVDSQEDIDTCANVYRPDLFHPYIYQDLRMSKVVLFTQYYVVLYVPNTRCKKNIWHLLQVSKRKREVLTYTSPMYEPNSMVVQEETTDTAAKAQDSPDIERVSNLLGMEEMPSRSGKNNIEKGDQFVTGVEETDDCSTDTNNLPLPVDENSEYNANATDMTDIDFQASAIKTEIIDFEANSIRYTVGNIKSENRESHDEDDVMEMRGEITSKGFDILRHDSSTIQDKTLSSEKYNCQRKSVNMECENMITLPGNGNKFKLSTIAEDGNTAIGEYEQNTTSSKSVTERKAYNALETENTTSVARNYKDFTTTTADYEDFTVAAGTKINENAFTTTLIYDGTTVEGHYYEYDSVELLEDTISSTENKYNYENRTITTAPGVKIQNEGVVPTYYESGSTEETFYYKRNTMREPENTSLRTESKNKYEKSTISRDICKATKQRAKVQSRGSATTCNESESTGKKYYEGDTTEVPADTSSTLKKKLKSPTIRSASEMKIQSKCFAASKHNNRGSTTEEYYHEKHTTVVPGDTNASEKKITLNNSTDIPSVDKIITKEYYNYFESTNINNSYKTITSDMEIKLTENTKPITVIANFDKDKRFTEWYDETKPSNRTVDTDTSLENTREKFYDEGISTLTEVSENYNYRPTLRKPTVKHKTEADEKNSSVVYNNNIAILEVSENHKFGPTRRNENVGLKTNPDLGTYADYNDTISKESENRNYSPTLRKGNVKPETNVVKASSVNKSTSPEDNTLTSEEHLRPDESIALVGRAVKPDKNSRFAFALQPRMTLFPANVSFEDLWKYSTRLDVSSRPPKTFGSQLKVTCQDLAHRGVMLFGGLRKNDHKLLMQNHATARMQGQMHDVHTRDDGVPYGSVKAHIVVSTGPAWCLVHFPVDQVPQYLLTFKLLYRRKDQNTWHSAHWAQRITFKKIEPRVKPDFPCPPWPDFSMFCIFVTDHIRIPDGANHADYEGQILVSGLVPRDDHWTASALEYPTKRYRFSFHVEECDATLPKGVSTCLGLGSPRVPLTSTEDWNLTTSTEEYSYTESSGDQGALLNKPWFALLPLIILLPLVLFIVLFFCARRKAYAAAMANIQILSPPCLPVNLLLLGPPGLVSMSCSDAVMSMPPCHPSPCGPAGGGDRPPSAASTSVPTSSSGGSSSCCTQSDPGPRRCRFQRAYGRPPASA